jgi:hypothetical protein
LRNLSDCPQLLLYILFWQNWFELSRAFAVRHERVVLALLALDAHNILLNYQQANAHTGVNAAT